MYKTIKSQESTQIKINSLQYLRGIACILVVLTHSNFYELNSYLMSNFHVYLGMIGVYIFFMISGFVIPLSVEKLNLKQFTIRRFFRIYPVFLVAVIIFCLVTNPLNIWNHLSSKSYGLFFTTDFLFDPRSASEEFMPVSWTLCIEMEFYFLIGLMAYFWKKIDAKVLMLLQIFLIGIRCYTDIRFLFLTWGALHVMFLGTIAFIYLKNKKIDNFLLGNLVIVIIGLGLAYFKNLDGGDQLIPINFILAVGLVLVFIRFVQNAKGNLHRIMSFFGDISYPLYLLHVPVVYFFSDKLILNYNFYAIIAAVAMISLSYLVHLLVEKPCISFSKNSPNSKF